MTKPAALIELNTARLEGDRFTMVMPFPSSDTVKALGPNGRPHWATRGRETRAMRTTARLLTCEALPRAHKPWERAALQIGFYWPDLRRRDTKNYEAVYKAAIDGIADGGLLVDDNWTRLDCMAPVSELDRSRPRVEIFIQRAEDSNAR